jgi:hypothetical protein
MLNNKLFYVILVQQILTRESYSTERETSENQSCKKGVRNLSFILKASYSDLMHKLEMKVEDYGKIIKSGEDFFKNNSDYSINRLYQYLVGYHENVVRIITKHEIDSFPVGEYEECLTENSGAKRALALVLYETLCHYDRKLDLLKFAIQLGKNDISELIVKLKGPESEYLNRLKKMPTDYYNTYLSEASNYQKVKEGFFKELVKFMGGESFPPKREFLFYIGVRERQQNSIK